MRNKSDVVHLEESGVEIRLAFEHVQARRCNAPFLERLDERRIVDDPAASGVDDHRRRLHQRKLPSADKMMGLRRKRHVEADEIGFLEEPLRAHILRAQLLFDRLRHAPAVMVEDAHRESLRAPRDGPADAAHADDAERRVVHVDAEELIVLPTLPASGPKPALGFGYAPRSGHEQRPGHVRGRVVEYARRIGREDASLGAGREVDVVVADRDVAHGFQSRRRGERRRVHAV